jgi:hypothetical protein
VGIAWRTEDKGERGSGRDYGPVRCRVEAIPPGVGTLHFATIEVNHSRVEF